MTTNMFEYTKTILTKVSFDSHLFSKELQKALKFLSPYEIEKLEIWVQKFTQQEPQLRQINNSVDKKAQVVEKIPQISVF